MKSYPMSKSTCPYCGYVSDHAGTIEEHKAGPKEGDVSVCLKCGGICLFDESLNIVKPTEEEFHQIRQGEHWPLVYKSSILAKVLSKRLKG